MSKKKAPKGVFYGSAGGSFMQKKKVVLGNIKHSGDEKDISLSKSSSGNSVYTDVNSLFGDNKVIGMTDVNSGSHLGLAVTTSKTKHVNTGVGFDFPLSSSNFYMEDDEIVSVKKSFTLDINLSAVEGKSATAKTQVIRKNFSSINGFGRATTPSKFEKIIRSTFTSEKSMIKAASLAREKRIVINMIKKFFMNTPKDMIITAVSEFGEIKSITIQLIGMWQKTVIEFVELNQTNLIVSKWSFLIDKNSVHVAKAVGNCETWASRNQFQVLLFTLPVGTIAHNLRTLLDGTGGKTCIINRSLETGNRICCVIVGFESDNNLESAFRMEPILGSIKLSWARMNLKFGHFALECDASVASPLKPSRRFKRVVSNECYLQLAKLYKKKSVLISHPIAFGGKSWTQVVMFADFSGGLRLSSGSGSSLPLSSASDSKDGSPLISTNTSSLNAHLAILECSLELLTDQVSGILKKLSGMELKSMVTPSCTLLLSTPTSLVLYLNVDMVLDDTMLASASSLLAIDNVVYDFGLSFSKVLTSKVGELESKMVVFEVSISSVLKRLDCLCSGAGSSALSSSQ
ncbi:hypothetical protein G9A89_010837 [Geosiphon pyriformis]|nr:hypothetical protein G9A89_010837 [Geosiphon pyriformis]